MPRVEYQGTWVEVQGGETVLDALLRAGRQVSYSCRAGVCGSCMMRAAGHTAPPPAAQTGLKDAWRASGYFLACLCHLESDLVAAPVGDEARVPVKISALERLTDSVLRVRLVPQAPFEFRAGQFVALIREDGLARSYSVASLPVEGMLELHVRVLPNGQMSQWLATEARVGATLAVQGPSGECFYVPGREDQPLLLAGTGTGLAPLYGIARDALAQGHRGPIHLFHGVLNAAGLYLGAELAVLAAAAPNFTYTLATLVDDGPLDMVILDRIPALKGWRSFLCGDPTLVQALRKKLFLAGAALNDIHADAFLPSAT